MYESGNYVVVKCFLHCSIYLHKLFCQFLAVLDWILFKVQFTQAWRKHSTTVHGLGGSSNHIMCRPALLIGPDSKYPQLNPPTTYQEQDVVNWCWLYTLDLSPCYTAVSASWAGALKKVYFICTVIILVCFSFLCEADASLWVWWCELQPWLLSCEKGVQK